MVFIHEKTYTLPITLARGLRIRARTKKRKKRRTEKPGGVPTHSRRSFPFQGTLGPQANCRSGPEKKSRHHEVDVSSSTQLFSRSTWEEGLKERDIWNVTFDFSPEHGNDEDANRHAVVEKRKTCGAKEFGPSQRSAGSLAGVHRHDPVTVNWKQRGAPTRDSPSQRRRRQKKKPSRSAETRRRRRKGPRRQAAKSHARAPSVRSPEAETGPTARAPKSDAPRHWSVTAAARQLPHRSR